MKSTRSCEHEEYEVACATTSSRTATVDKQLGCGVPAGRTPSLHRDRTTTATGGRNYNPATAGAASVCPQGTTAAPRSNQEKRTERWRSAAGTKSGEATVTTGAAMQRPFLEEEAG